MAYLLIFGSASYGRGLATGQFGLNSLAQLKEGKTPWHVQLASNEQLVERKAVASELASLPKPLFIRDEVFLLPWYATVCRYPAYNRSEEHTSELQSLRHLVCRLLLEKKKTKND